MATTEYPEDSVLRRHQEQLRNAGPTGSPPAAAFAKAPTGRSPDPVPDDLGAASSDGSVAKLLAWFGLLVLIGVLVLYHWYTGSLKGDIAGRQEQIAEAQNQLTQADEKLGLLAQKEQDLRADMAARSAQFEADSKALSAQVDAAKKEIARLENEMVELRRTNAEKLATARAEAADKYAELQGRYDEANATIASLKEDIAGLQQDMQAAATQHQADMEAAKADFSTQRKQIEEAMEERIGFYRTALEGSEPERAAQLVQLDKRIDSLLGEVNVANAAIGALETAKAQLEGELAGAQDQIQEGERTLAETERKRADLQESLTERENELRDLQETYDAAVVEAADELAAAQEELRVANEKHAAESAEAAALLELTRTEAARAAAEAEKAMNQAAERHAAEVARAENRITGLTTDLETEKAALAALEAKYDETVEDLNAKLASTEQSLADTDAKLAAAIADAEASKTMLESQIADGEARILELEQNIETERQQAADRLAETQQKNRERLADLRTLYTDLSLLGGTQTDKGMLLSLADTELRFRIGGKELPKDLPSLDKIAELMQKYPKLNARIEGHTDSSGREETNLELSKERANAVMEALVERGVDPGRLTAEGFGQSRPIASNDTRFGRLKNRRVEVYVTDTE